MIKTRKQLLEEMYNSFHSQKIQTEIVIDSKQSRIIKLIDPKAKPIVDVLQKEVAELKISMGNAQKAMDRIMEKIKQEK